MGKWLDRVTPDAPRTVPAAHEAPGFGSHFSRLNDQTTKLDELEHGSPPVCRPCGRRQHLPDVICGPQLCASWAEPDPAWPIALAYVPPPSREVV